MKKHIIVKTIRKIYLAKLIPALLFISFTILVFFHYPFMETLFPNRLENTNDIFQAYNSGEEYLQVSVPTLYYTGYDYTHNSQKRGSYYYSFIDDKCVFFLLSNKTSNKTLTELSNLTIHGKLITDTTQSAFLIDHFSSDLSWTDTELSKITSSFIVSELDASPPTTYALLAIIGIVDVCSLVRILLSLTFIFVPHFSSICKHLGRGKASKLALQEADLELSNNRYFYVSDMSITSHYFIDLGKYHAKIIPLNSIIWAYKHSKMNKLWGISYTLIIYSNNSVSKFTHKQKYDIDFILEYLNENCPNVVIGNSKEHRILAMERFKK